MFKILSPNFFKFLGSEVITRAFPFIVTLYIASLLGTSLFGEFILYWTLAEVILIIVSFNIQSTTRVYFFTKTKDELSKIAFFQLSICILLSLSLFIFFFLISYLQLFSFNLEVAAIIILASIFRSLSNYALSIFQCNKKPNYFLITNLTYVLINSFTLLLFLNPQNFLFVWSISMLISAIAQCLVSLPKVINYLDINNRSSINKAEVLSFTFFYYPQTISWMLKPTFERIAIISILGASYLGQYGLATQISSMLLLFAGVINLVTLPDLNKTLLERNFDQTKRIFRKIYLLLLPSIAFVLFGGVYFIDNYYDYQYKYSGEILPLFVLSILPHLMVIVKTPVLYFFEDSKYVAFSVMLTFTLYGICIYLIQDFLTIERILLLAFLANTVLMIAIETKVIKKMKMNKDV